MSERKRASGVERRAGGERKEKVTATSTVHEVAEVYVYIPPELSAAGVELKLAGSVRIVNKAGECYLTWSPSDISQQDVASLYLAQADSWAVVDQFVEPPEVINDGANPFPDAQYSVRTLDTPDPILIGSTRVQAGESPSVSKDKTEKSTRDGEAHISGIVTRVIGSAHSSTSDEKAKQLDTVNFALSQLHSVRESAILLLLGTRSLTFFLKDGSELPTLHFHDGGTNGLLLVLQRYLYLERDRHSDQLYLVKEFDKSSDKPLRHRSGSRAKKAAVEGIVSGVIGGAMGNIIGITRAVRQHFIPDTRLQEVRPGTEGGEEDEFAEKIQTVAMSDVVPGNRGGGEGREDVDPDVSLITDFQVITDIRGKLPPRLPPLPPQPPLSHNEWETLRGREGRIGPEEEARFRARVFAGGVEPSLRKEVWRYLLNYFPYGSSDIERMELQQQRERQYWQMKGQWESFTADQERRFSKWREARNLINKDVLRTDREVEMFHDSNNHRLTQLEDILRTYVMYNFDLGYVQGMSDLLAPLLAVMESEVDTFWCFVGFMDMVGHHFEESQTGMRNRLKQLRALLNVADPQFYQFLKSKESNNLYFCFRWLLIHFKREFEYPVLMRLWEVIWTGYLSPDYALFVALAILETEKGRLYKPAHDFSDILQHINSLSKKMELEPILQLAEVLCRQLAACSDLPDDLKCLVIRPSPQRFASVVGMETIVCSPEGSAIPSENCAGQSGDVSASSAERGVPSADVVAQFDDAMLSVNDPSMDCSAQSADEASNPVPNEDSIQSTNSFNNLVV